MVENAYIYHIDGTNKVDTAYYIYHIDGTNKVENAYIYHIDGTSTLL